MTISKTRLGLLALPLLATGVIGVAALGTSHSSAATPTPTQSQAASADTPEANDTADAADPADANEPKNGPDTDNVQDGPQSGTQDSQADGENPNL